MIIHRKRTRRVCKTFVPLIQVWCTCTLNSLVFSDIAKNNRPPKGLFPKTALVQTHYNYLILNSVARNKLFYAIRLHMHQSFIIFEA